MKFTGECASNEINFLDTTIYKGTNFLYKHLAYSKPTNKSIILLGSPPHQKNEWNIGGIGKCAVPNWWHPHIWQQSASTWHKTYGSSRLDRKGGCYSEPNKMGIRSNSWAISSTKRDFTQILTRHQPSIRCPNPKMCLNCNDFWVWSISSENSHLIFQNCLNLYVSCWALAMLGYGTEKTIKTLLQQADDPHLALLNYRATPLPWCGLSPAELLFGQRPRTTIPQVTSWMAAIPQSILQIWWTGKKETERKLRQVTRCSSTIRIKQWNWDRQTRGRVVATAGTPRSYIVSTSGGIVCRNRQHLIMVPGIQQGGHLEDNSNETLVTEENSMNDDVNPSDEGNNDSESGDDEENYQQCIQPERSRPIATRTRTGIVISLQIRLWQEPANKRRCCVIVFRVYTAHALWRGFYY